MRTVYSLWLLSCRSRGHRGHVRDQVIADLRIALRLGIMLP